MSEIKITQIEVAEPIHDIGTVASKQFPPGSRYRYYIEVTYILENGTRLTSQIRGLTKPKLQERIQSTKKNIELNSMFAEQYDYGSGPHWSFVTKYYIGPR